jgi:protein-S-isoprenylcysteine O-methyltransferase Ste14
MVVNPRVKPRVVTPGLVWASAVVLVAVVLFLTFVVAAEPPSLREVVVGGLLLAAALLLGALWRKRVNQRNTWLVDAKERWKSFDRAKLASRTTTEVTLSCCGDFGQRN